ncbi:MAG: C40 family peptidase, partial [Actinomycetales bacterium]
MTNQRAGSSIRHPFPALLCTVALAVSVTGLSVSADQGMTAVRSENRSAVTAVPLWQGDPPVYVPMGVVLTFNNSFVLSSAAPVPPGLVENPGPGSFVDPSVVGTLSSSRRAVLLAAAYAGLGRPYVWGGTSALYGWDCSGFVQWAYRQAGIELPRTEQWRALVPTDSPRPGDLVVQNPDGPDHWSHVGIYIGEGKMISALNPTVGTVLLPVALTESRGTSRFFTVRSGAPGEDPIPVIPEVPWPSPEPAPRQRTGYPATARPPRPDART